MNLPIIAITGASAGIGSAVAHTFAKAGCQLVLLARREEKLASLRKELGTKNVIIFKLDVTSRKAVEETFALIEKEVGSIDILINNAGGAFGLEKGQEANLDNWDKCIAVNINGLIYCTRAVLPGMVQRNKGHIINIGSVAGLYPYPGGNVYAGSKAFVHQFSLSLRADLLGTRVRVTCIEPGLVGETEFSLVRFGGDEKRAQQVYKGTEPLQPEDIAKVIRFCTELPEHVNINTIELMPVGQAFSPLTVHRTE